MTTRSNEIQTIHGMQTTINYQRDERDEIEQDAMRRAAEAGDAPAMRKILDLYTTRVLFGKGVMR